MVTQAVVGCLVEEDAVPFAARPQGTMQFLMIKSTDSPSSLSIQGRKGRPSAAGTGL